MRQISVSNDGRDLTVRGGRGQMKNWFSTETDVSLGL